MRRGLATYLRLSSTEGTLSETGRRSRFLLSGGNPLQGERRPPSWHTMGLRLTGRLGRRDGRKAQLRGGRRAALFFAVTPLT